MVNVTIIPSRLSREINAFYNLRHSFLSLFISGMASLVAGIVLGTSEEILTAIPGLLILIPAIMGMRGNIFATLASRLGSAFHMGSLKSFDMNNPILRSNFFASLSLGIIFSVYLAFVAKVTSLIFGIRAMSIAEFVSISVIATLISGVVMLFAAIWVSFYSYKRKWDPDSITSPLITATGDIITIPSILVSAIIVSFIQGYTEILLYASVLFSLLTLYTLILPLEKTYYKKILKESMPVLGLSGIISVFAGLIFESYLHQIVFIPIILIFMPSFMGTAGNLTNVLSSRLASRLHLGIMSPKFDLKQGKLEEITNSMRLAYIIFLFIGIMAFFIGSAIEVTGLGLMQMAVLSLISGVILHAILLIMAMAVSFYSFSHNIDPDNVTIPIITSIADMGSIFILISMIRILGFA